MSAEEMLSAVLTKIESLEKEIKQLQEDRYPRLVGMQEACKILDIKRTTMTKRLKEGYYPYAFQESSGQWRFPLNELTRNIAR
jgi:hypothetical protein